MKTTKNKDKRALWLQNPGTSDVNIGDLGVKVPAGKTINIFAYNPYLSEEKVETSKGWGSLARRLLTGVLKIVKKAPTGRPSILDQIKASKNAARVTKTKSSVIIESNNNEEEGETFDFADYGISDIISHENNAGAILVNTKQDNGNSNKEEITGTIKLSPKEEMGQSKQTRIVMDASKKTNLLGSEKTDTLTSETPFIVTKGDKLSETETKTDIVFHDKDSIPQVIVDKTMVTNKEESDPSVQSKSKTLTPIPIDDDKNNSTVLLNKARATDDALKVATKTEDGVIIMQIKDAEVNIEESKAEKKPVKRVKRTGSSKKKS